MTREVEPLIRAHHPSAYRYAYVFTRNRDEAKDAVQEALRRVVASWKRYDSGRPFAPYFTAILRNVLIERSRARRFNLPIEGCGPKDDDLSAVPLADGGENCLDQMIREERIGKVRKAFAALKRFQRRAIFWVDMNGLSYDDAARKLGVPSGTVRSRLHRARRIFKMRYLAQGGEAFV